MRSLDPEAERDFVSLIEAMTNFVQNERVRAYNEGVDSRQKDIAVLECARLSAVETGKKLIKDNNRLRSALQRIRNSLHAHKQEPR